MLPSGELRAEVCGRWRQFSEVVGGVWKFCDATGNYWELIDSDRRVYPIEVSYISDEF